MPNFTAWLSNDNSPLSDIIGDTTSTDAVMRWHMIALKPASIVIERGRSTTLAAQTVRLEYSISEREREDDTGQSVSRDIYLFGVKGHPSITDTDVQTGDRFLYNGQIWRIDSIVFLPGGIEAKGVVIT